MLPFIAITALWVVFGAALLVQRELLVDAWTSFRGHPLVVQGIEGIVFLPWVAGLAIWNAGWAVSLRLLLIAGLALATLYAFLPWRAA
jgi:hypothetical protein